MRATLRYRVCAVLPSVTLATVLAVTGCNQAPSVAKGAEGSATIAGTVQVAGGPVAGSTVTLYAASDGAPAQLAQATSGDDGSFSLAGKPSSGKGGVLYIVARGGTPKAAGASGPGDALSLLTVLGTAPPKQVTVNELTTVASAFTSARFLTGEVLQGNPLGLRIAAGNAPNLVDPATGGWGRVVVDPLNSTQNTTLASLNTLGSLVSAFATTADGGWRERFLKAAALPGSTPRTSLEAVAGIARQPWANPTELYALFDAAYPQPKDGGNRAAPFIPYLTVTPPDFALMLAFAGGGLFAPGRLMFDTAGNLWSGQNWTPGSQATVMNNIGGHLVKFAPDGTPLSPPISGFTGMGLDGVGWGTAVTRDRVWISGLNGKILVTDLAGHPVASESDFPFKERMFGLMGIGVAANGDVWIADGSGDQLLYFPGGRLADGKIVKPKGLRSPFDVVIDSQNRVWVSNSQGATVVRFPADDPTKAEAFKVGVAVRGLALDSKENVWVSSNLSFDFPPPKIPEGVPIMKQFQLAGEHMVNVLSRGKLSRSGVIQMIRPDGTMPAGYSPTEVNVPWGINIDGNDDVWVPVFWGRSVVLMAGADPKGHAPGTKPGDVIHAFKSGSIQMLTDVNIDPAGNVWAANNWNDVSTVLSNNPAWPKSTWGGGSGLTVIYGVASPVKPPRMGKVVGY